jgi:putative hydrolase of the HAD superfamily
MLDTKPIRAVTFDAGGTLLRPALPVGEIYARVAHEFGLREISAVELEESFQREWRCKGEFDYSQEAWYALVRRTFGHHAEKLPDAFYPALYEAFAQPEVWQLFEDALPALDELASLGIPLGVISNWDNRLRPLLSAFKLTGFFDVIIPSCEVAFHKPSPVIFEMAIRQLGLPPEQILHVGDHFLEDVEGARAAGLQALHLVRGAVHKTAGQITSLIEIPTVVELAGGHLLAFPENP